jgi:hypothetical protein
MSLSSRERAKTGGLGIRLMCPIVLESDMSSLGLSGDARSYFSIPEMTIRSIFLFVNRKALLY